MLDFGRLRKNRLSKISCQCSPLETPFIRSFEDALSMEKVSQLWKAVFCWQWSSLKCYSVSKARGRLTLIEWSFSLCACLLVIVKVTNSGTFWPESLIIDALRERIVRASRDQKKSSFELLRSQPMLDLHAQADHLDLIVALPITPRNRPFAFAGIRASSTCT